MLKQNRLFQMKCRAHHKCLLIRQQCYFLSFLWPNQIWIGNRCVVCSLNEHWTPPPPPSPPQDSVTFYWREKKEKRFSRWAEERIKNSMKIKIPYPNEEKTKKSIFDLWNILPGTTTNLKLKEIVLIIGKAHKICVPTLKHIRCVSSHSHRHFQPQNRKYWWEKFIIYSLYFHRWLIFSAFVCVCICVNQNEIGWISYRTASGTWLKWCRRTEE